MGSAHSGRSTGSSRSRTDSQVMQMTTRCGSMAWTAPEVLILGGARDGIFYSLYGLAADVYSFSVVIWEVITRRLPWGEIKFLSQILTKVTNGERLQITNAERMMATIEACGLLELMETCWEQDPVKRPTFTDIVTTIDFIRKKLVVHVPSPVREFDAASNNRLLSSRSVGVNEARNEGIMKMKKKKTQFNSLNLQYA